MVTVGCDEGYLTCDNLECIEESWFCDGDQDCGDGSDEQNCAGTCTILLMKLFLQRQFLSIS